MRGGRLHHHVRRCPPKQGLGIIADVDPQLTAEAQDFPQLPASLGRMGVDGPHHLDVLPLQRYPEDLAADGTNAIVDSAEFLLHGDASHRFASRIHS